MKWMDVVVSLGEIATIVNGCSHDLKDANKRVDSAVTIMEEVRTTLLQALAGSSNPEVDVLLANVEYAIKDAEELFKKIRDLSDLAEDYRNRGL